MEYVPESLKKYGSASKLGCQCRQKHKRTTWSQVQTRNLHSEAEIQHLKKQRKAAHDRGNCKPGSFPASEYHRRKENRSHMETVVSFCTPYTAVISRIIFSYLFRITSRFSFAESLNSHLW